jgi:hypothetical protein
MKAGRLYCDLGKANDAVADANTIAEGKRPFIKARGGWMTVWFRPACPFTTTPATSGAAAAGAGAPEACSGGTSALRGLARDVFDVGAIDADVVQLTIGVGGQLAHRVPIHATLTEITADGFEVHGWLLVLSSPAAAAKLSSA